MEIMLLAMLATAAPEFCDALPIEQPVCQIDTDWYPWGPDLRPRQPCRKSDGEGDGQCAVAPQGTCGSPCFDCCCTWDQLDPTPSCN